MYRARVETEFAAAHFLSLYHGKCENLHGHNYRVRLHLRGDSLDSGGMLADFSILKKALKEACAPLDHSSLNDMDIFENNPSAEKIARYIFEKISELLPALGIEKSLIHAIDVFETPSNMASYTKD